VTPRTLLLVTFAGFAAASIGSTGALAASPSYCALYSREYALNTVQPTAAAGMFQSIQDQAYYRCLNQDEDPPLPQKSAYFGTDVTKAGAASAANAATRAAIATDVTRPAATSAAIAADAAKPGAANAATSAAIADTIVTPPIPKPAPPRTIVTANASRAPAPYRGSQMQAWTPEWAAWCARNFPNSWDAKSGTVLHYGSGDRELCK
jgi:hypothetical protein